MKWLIVLCMILGSASAFSTTGQATTCPPDLVCISREAALKALADADKVKALEAFVKVLEQASKDKSTEIETMRREFIQASVEATFYKQQVALLRLDIEKLLKMTKCKPFAICVNLAR